MGAQRSVQYIAGSGFGEPRPVPAEELLGLASTMIPAAGAPHAPFQRSVTGEASCHLGPMTRGPVQGCEIGEAWAAIALGGDEALLQAVDPLRARRAGRSAVLSTPEEIMTFWREERQRLRAICIVGTSTPWWIQEQLQLDGALVGRLPFDDPGLLASYAKRRVEFERGRIASPRVGWIISAAPDPFVSALRGLFADELTRRLQASGFDVIHVEAGGAAPPGPPPAVVILLTHGADPPDPGDPVGLGAAIQGRILEACGEGALLLHLGCNGAGMVRGGRFGQLPRQLGLERCPLAAADVFSRFGQRCLAAGACAVLAHVDSTWSIAFEHPGPIGDWIDWTCSGRGAVAHAADSIFAESNRAGALAHERRQSGDAIGAGKAWLRHLDLKGFVVLGDPSAHIYRSRR